MYLIYQTDNHHTRLTANLIGVCTTKTKGLRIIKQFIITQAEPKLSTDDLFNLANYSQTQGYKGEGEFVIDKVEVNKLL